MTTARCLRLVALASVTAAALSAVPALAASPPLPGAACGGPAVVETVARERRTDRTTDYVLRSPASEADVSVRVVLPERVEPGRRYPVLYLFHGTGGDHTWNDAQVGLEAVTREHDVIVVNPDGGAGGFYSDWWNYGQPGAPTWETFHLDELVPWVESALPAACGRAGRMAAGISMGGFGALSYAARRPDVFATAASFSGAVDTNYFDPLVPEAYSAWPALDGGIPTSIWGSRTAEEVRWRGHNPTDLAENLGYLARLAVYTGDGRDQHGLYTDSAEGSAYQQAVSLHEALQRAQVSHAFEYYRPGTHTGPFWAASLSAELPLALAALRHAAEPPELITHRSIERAFDAFGWRVETSREALEFSRLADAGVEGFVVSGSGRARVTTAALYRPGQRYRVVGTGGPPVEVVADRTGRLVAYVDLGPSRTVQQYRGTVAVDTGPASGGGPFNAPPNPVPETRLPTPDDFLVTRTVRVTDLSRRR